MKQYKIGYTQGVYDMFHIGHLNLIKNAKRYCDYLIVGINSDSLVQEYKYKIPVIDQESRKVIVENIKVVDKAIIVHTLNKIELYRQLKFNAIFIGSDWEDNPRWQETKIQLAQYNIDVIFLPYTNGISSTILRPKENKKINE